ncbi:MAG: hypothetical protein GXO83_10155 [Chlorobi bacterium]|nr:hypothetical protein [Chlorobiota bacterium]
MKQKTLSPVYLYVIDEFGQISGDISQRFDNPEKYAVLNFTSFRQFLENTDIPRIPGIRKANIRIIIYVLNRHLQNSDSCDEALEVLHQVHNLPDKYSTIFLVDSNYKDKGQPVLEAGAGAWIINNPNAIHWIDNHVKGTISRSNLDKKRKASKLALRILAVYIILVSLFTLAARFLFPWYF